MSSLQLILGNAGSGKTRLLYETIIRESLESPKKQFLVIVPEQFTLQTQKELVGLHPAHGIRNIDAISFKRLAWRIFEETGVGKQKVLEETGKNLLLRKVAQEKKDQLKVLGGNMKKQGFLTQVKSMISELTQYDISPGMLGELLESQQLTSMLSIQQQRDRYMARQLLSAPVPSLLIAGGYHASKSMGVPLHMEDLATGTHPVVLMLAEKGMNITVDHADYVWFVAPDTTKR